MKGLQKRKDYKKATKPKFSKGNMKKVKKKT